MFSISSHAVGVLAVLAIAGVSASPAQAQSSANAYAIVVGSNPGGPGQATLKYAERDARSVASLLADIGGYPKANIHLLSRPTPEQLLATIDKVALRLKADAAAGKQSVVLFYYSGHARSKSINLGNREVALGELRKRIVALPAALRLVILDACQSGSFSGVKGVAPAADFSFNSVAKLNATGVAVMASSAATELSQESSRLGASYFTHYLLVGLRGAGDRNRDGRVSITEAYKYAYDRTLVATAKTAVGRQHVTLETDLKGKGDVAMSYPARADAQLELPAKLRGEVLVSRRSGGVIAEVYKSRGTLRIALARGSYRLLVRTGRKVKQCDLVLTRGNVKVLDINACTEVRVDRNATKGGGFLLRSRWSIEAGFGLGGYVEDGFTQRLADFGYDQGGGFGGHYSLSVAYRLHRHIDVVGNVSRLAADTFNRPGDTEQQTFSFATHGFAALLRGIHSTPGGLLSGYAQAGAGLARASTSLRVGENPADNETHWGLQLRAGVGAQLMPWRAAGFFGQVSYVTAPVITNLLDDTHDSGGTFVTVGARMTF